jgi:hypothetical protein
MGQYYRVVNITKKQIIDPYIFGSGMKLMEFTSDGMSVMQGLGILLADGNNRGGGDLRSSNPVIGSWAGDKIVVTGDYADDGKFLLKRNSHMNLYDFSKNFEDVSKEVVKALCDDPWWGDNYFNRWKEMGFSDWDEERQQLKVDIFGEKGCNYKK